MCKLTHKKIYYRHKDKDYHSKKDFVTTFPVHGTN
jgi:hypothetical protein